MHKTMFKKIRTHLIGSVAAMALLTSFGGVASAQEEEHKWTANVRGIYTIAGRAEPAARQWMEH